VEYLRGRPCVPQGKEFDRAAQWWLSRATPDDAEFDDEIIFDAADIEPTVTWGITPAQSIGVSQRLPNIADCAPGDQVLIREAMKFMDLGEGSPIEGTRIDVAFIGSCTNSRISDLREAARVVEGRKVAEGVKAIVVPGSQLVREQAMGEGLHEVFEAAGFEWREAGCSMCLAMNPDKLHGREVCASSSNRNFKGRQGSPTGRTLLMSPAMVAAAAITGHVTDIRQFALAGV
jgi:3-isopropylmalate/(R)-2-methylmalate dehydratase large subunit